MSTEDTPDGGGSMQLRRYVALRREGVERADACFESGLSEAEAALVDADEARGELGAIKPPPRKSRVSKEKGAVAAAPSIPSGEGISTMNAETEKPEVEEVDAGGFLSDKIADVTIEFAAATLKGDVRDKFLEIIKHLPRTYAEMTEAQKRDVLHSVERLAGYIIEQACETMAAGGRQTIVGSLKTYKQKDNEVEAQVKFLGSWEVIAALHHACGSTVQLVAVNDEDFKGQRKPVEVEPDQGSVFDATTQGEDLAGEQRLEAAE
jgi:hypothetical protein